MRLPDWLTGAVLLVLALAVLWHVQSFPDIPGQAYGAGLFPGLAATGLALASLALIGGSLRRRAAGEPRRDSGSGSLIPDPDAVAVHAPEPPLRGRRLVALLLSIAAVAFYVLAAPALGFIVTGIVLLSVLMWAFGARPALIVPVAVVATLLIHGAFYKLLKVPLPWGLLQPIAW
jgi:putative tricarboxylic transport membrane protein